MRMLQQQGVVLQKNEMQFQDKKIDLIRFEKPKIDFFATQGDIDMSQRNPPKISKKNISSVCVYALGNSN